MPELAEVEAWRRLAEQHVAGRTIQAVYAARDTIIFDTVPPQAFARHLKSRTILGVKRKGKHLWMELDRAPHPYFHFGMSGSFSVYRATEDRPDYLKAELRMENGTRLGYRNIRRIGRIRLMENPEQQPPISELGFDPYLEWPPLSTFRAYLAHRHAPIKSVLLDQRFAAGIGNWLADEILYQAGIMPSRKAHRLSVLEIRRLRQKMKTIVNKAVAVDADDSRFPKTWLFHYRWGKPKDARSGKGEAIRFDTIGGRTTAWVPAVQQ